MTAAAFSFRRRFSLWLAGAACLVAGTGFALAFLFDAIQVLAAWREAAAQGGHPFYAHHARAREAAFADNASIQLAMALALFTASLCAFTIRTHLSVAAPRPSASSSVE